MDPPSALAPQAAEAENKTVYTTVVPTNNEADTPATTDNRLFSWRVFVRNRWVRIAVLWTCLALLLIPHGILVFKWPKGDYGIGVLRESTNCGSNWKAFIIFIIQGPINALAQLLVYGTGYIRVATQRAGGKRFSPWQLWLCLLSIPAHLLYNSLIFDSISAYDAYEVLVSDALFLQGRPFNLTAVQLLPTAGKEDPLRLEYNMTTPGLSKLNDSMAQLQKSITSNHNLTGWKNLTFGECLNRYRTGTYNSFSHVIVVTNWTEPSDVNNSALGLTILAGQAGPKHMTRQALVSMCPQTFYPTFNVTKPSAWKYVPKGAVGLCDAYTPKKFDVKKHNSFVKYCLSKEEVETCRLLYSPLLLKIVSLGLLIAVVCLALSIAFAAFCRELKSTEVREEDQNWTLIILGLVAVFVAFTVQLALMATTSVSRRGPKNKSDQVWLLRAFCIINVVQLLESICDAFIVPWDTALIYSFLNIIWTWYLSGVFSMQAKDRHMLTSSPDPVVIPNADLSSNWFKSFFENVVRNQFYASLNKLQHLPGELTGFYAALLGLLLIIVFATPLVLRGFSKPTMYLKLS